MVAVKHMNSSRLQLKHKGPPRQLSRLWGLVDFLQTSSKKCERVGKEARSCIYEDYRSYWSYKLVHIGFQIWLPDLEKLPSNNWFSNLKSNYPSHNKLPDVVLNYTCGNSVAGSVICFHQNTMNMKRVLSLYLEGQSELLVTLVVDLVVTFYFLRAVESEV